MSQEQRTVSILFADLKDFSKIPTDALQVKVVNVLREEVENRILTRQNHFLQRTQGDGYLICSNSPVALAEVALRMRDAILNTNWKALGLEHNIAARIALHVQTVTVVSNEDGSVDDVLGRGVNKTARIEPVTDPNEVFCSDIFQRHLADADAPHIAAIPIGIRELAKGYGAQQLYRLIWAHQAANLTSVPAKPTEGSKHSIKLPFTDKERTDFLHHAFNEIRLLLSERFRQETSEQPAIETVIHEDTGSKFVYEIFLNGQSRGGGKLWIGGLGRNYDSIFYSGDMSGFANGSWNQSFQVVDDGHELHLQSAFGGLGVALPNRLTPQQVSEHLWGELIRALGR
jgi:class 3 adenylate cyclase